MKVKNFSHMAGGKTIPQLTRLKLPCSKSWQSTDLVLTAYVLGIAATQAGRL